MKVGDEAAARVEASVADAQREQLDEDRPDAVAVLSVEPFGAAGEREHAHGVPRDDACAVTENRRDLLPEVVLRVPAFGIECGIGPYHGRSQNNSVGATSSPLSSTQAFASSATVDGPHYSRRRPTPWSESCRDQSIGAFTRRWPRTVAATWSEYYRETMCKCNQMSHFR